MPARPAACSLDTNICMIKENPEEGPTTASAGR